MLVTCPACFLIGESEWRTRNENAVLIYQEMERRKKKAEEWEEDYKASLPPPPKERAGTKTKQRMVAFAEMSGEKEVATLQQEEEKKEEEMGIFGKIKEFYNKADSMAAAQALLLNKKLEDEGIVEKITDESGLKVIGREAAKELEDEDKN